MHAGRRADLPGQDRQDTLPGAAAGARRDAAVPLGAPLSSDDWSRYYDATGEEPRDTLLEALARFEAEGTRGYGVDLGCGTGRDTVELLRRGWRVLALDGQAEAIRRLLARSLPAEWRTRLETRVSPFEESVWPEPDLVNSSFALPFCRPEAFPAIWSRIVASLQPGGRFSGQLFGDRDGWCGEEDMTFLTRESLDELLNGLDVERLDEVEEDGRTAIGHAKHWHLYHLVVRKP